MPELVFAYRKCGNKLSVHYRKKEELIKRQMREVGYDFESWSRNHGMWYDVFREVDEEKEKEKEREKEKQKKRDDDDDLLFKDVQEKEPPTSLIRYLISFII